ncbi:MAG: hypothetical protein PVG39_16885 [Desulfobacteraceae bacterium]
MQSKSSRRVTSTDVKGLKVLAEEKVFSDFYLVSHDPVETKKGNLHTIHWKNFLERLWSDKII